MTLPAGVTHVTNIKGDKGDKGDTGTIAYAEAVSVSAESPAQVSMIGPEANRGARFEIPRGLPGVNAVANDTATATYISAVDSATRAALDLVAIPRTLDPSDVQVQVQRRLRFVDVPAANGHVLEIDHYGDGKYGIDVQNFPGAGTALMVHQYSDAGNALLIDNTDTGTAIRVRNTENPVTNPGGYGTGKFIQFDDQGSVIFDVLATGDTWINAGAAAIRPGLLIYNRSAQHALDIQQMGTGGGVRIRNTGSGTGLMFSVGGSGAPGFALDRTGAIAIIDQASVQIRAGDGDPNGVVTAPRGSIYLRKGGIGPYFYVKETSGGDTGWVGK